MGGGPLGELQSHCEVSRKRSQPVRSADVQKSKVFSDTLGIKALGLLLMAQKEG